MRAQIRVLRWLMLSCFVFHSSFSLAELLTTMASEAQLAEMSQNQDLPLEQRTAATQQLGYFSGPNALIAIGRASRSPSIEMRMSSIQAAKRWQGRAKWDVVEPLLEDSQPRIQQAAIRALVPLWPSLPVRYQNKLDAKLQHYIAALPATQEGALEKAQLLRWCQRYTEAEHVLNLWQTKPNDLDVTIALAELYSDQHQEVRAIQALNQALVTDNDNAMLHYSLSLSYWRNEQVSLSFQHMQQAYRLEPNSATYSYMLGLMILDQEPQEAWTLFTQAYASTGNPQYLFSQCEARLSSQMSAISCLEKLRQFAPEEAVTALIDKYR
ncbi:hypothetical protein BCU70_13645 [Vibrio sp. 10N.286.49.C2]|uniref:hypothetical protein n=1 Tax=unclassified Vibrio TaxID=2614977 RepID=UPI000C859CBB|nr:MULTISPECIES: hypothetical protein [unclassified Vibrio]PMH38844.1 hypothetical protein BCU70_13645 [Vibrio sp. 10N.286.49.C2]PMH55320.1 hypothetical protein BCU66_09415 [Vibrio sp. 10N.286.49.B1]PMH83785.1 hypothetical protein BCU58_13430 [Vibrio sp. 10N.286.48.B7]